MAGPPRHGSFRLPVDDVDWLVTALTTGRGVSVSPGETRIVSVADAGTGAASSGATAGGDRDPETGPEGAAVYELPVRSRVAARPAEYRIGRLGGDRHRRRRDGGRLGLIRPRR